MDTLPQDQKVIDLLGKLKQAPNGYPSDMLSARRELYVKQMANIGLGLGAGTLAKNAAKGNGAGGAATVASKVLEITLVAAIAVEAGTVAYLYRNEIAAAVLSVVNPSATKVLVVEPPETAMPGTVGELETPVASLTSASETATVLPSETPGPVLAGDENPSGTSNNTSGANNVSVNATPNPGGNQGNQYGLTPKPERTKENQGENNDGSNNNNGGNNNNNGGNKDK